MTHALARILEEVEVVLTSPVFWTGVGAIGAILGALATLKVAKLATKQLEEMRQDRLSRVMPRLVGAARPEKLFEGREGKGLEPDVEVVLERPEHSFVNSLCCIGLKNQGLAPAYNVSVDAFNDGAARHHSPIPAIGVAKEAFLRIMIPKPKDEIPRHSLMTVSFEDIYGNRISQAIHVVVDGEMITEVGVAEAPKRKN
ncbi:MAG: hypothetical protein QME79_12465 [Bacillota bacterium]|nr:hypothetical protein [Bacillota bacterium]